MSVLTGPEIVRCVNRTKGFAEHGHVGPLPRIDIEPFDPSLAGPNSYDVHLGPTLLMYSPYKQAIALGLTKWGVHLDAKKPNPITSVPIPIQGLLLEPGTLYLGNTVERMSCEGVVPWIDGRSSIGRLGLSIHVTAGRGDDGWAGQWTLEITVVHPIMIYPNMRIGQVTFLTLDGERAPYKGRYQNQTDPTPSRYHEPTDPT